MSRVKANDGFTLVELLVVIGIIALLISILLPVLGRARDAAKSIACLSNLRQCGLGVQLYANSNRGFVIISRSNGGNIKMWPWFLSNGASCGDQMGGPVYITRAISICPANFFYANDVKKTTSTSTDNSGYPNIGYGMFRVDGFSGTGAPKPFAQNAFQSDTPMDGLPIATSSWWITTQKMQKLPAIQSESIFMADTLSRHGSTPDGGGHMIATFCDRQDGNAWNSGYGGHIQTNHGKLANLLFYDGHAESMTDGDIRTKTTTKTRDFYSHTGQLYLLP